MSLYTKKPIQRFAFLSLAIGASLTFAGPCPQGHCSKVSEQLNNMCISDGLKGQNVYVPGPGGHCYCGCSCFVAGTEISANDGTATVESITKGERLRTPAGPVEVSQVMATTVSDYPVLAFTLDNGSTVTVSRNHALITADGIVAEADSVKPGSELLTEAGAHATVVRVEPKTYSGSLHNYILKGSSVAGEDRIVLAGGVQSGDWEVQSHRDYLNANVGLREVISRVKAKN